MAKELPILPSTAQPAGETHTEHYQYSRVFCQKENSPPLRLLLEFLKSRGQTPITPPDMDDSMLDEWAWVQVTLGYDPNRKPIQVFCARDRGSYQDVFDEEKKEVFHQAWTIVNETYYDPKFHGANWSDVRGQYARWIEASRTPDEVRRIQAHGITVNGCLILGLDHQTPAIFQQVLDFALAIPLYEVQITVLTPFPGTPLYQRLAHVFPRQDEDTDSCWQQCNHLKKRENNWLDAPERFF